MWTFQSEKHHYMVIVLCKGGHRQILPPCMHQGWTISTPLLSSSCDLLGPTECVSGGASAVPSFKRLDTSASSLRSQVSHKKFNYPETA